ncbi:hypothetical protein MMPV_001201 [Pyropia vietnamensis]
MASRRRLPGSDRNDLLPGGGDLAGKSRRSYFASSWRFVRRRPVSAFLLVVVVAGVSAALVATVRHVPLPGVARLRHAADQGMEVVPPEDDVTTRLYPVEGGQVGQGTPPDGAGSASSLGEDAGDGGSTGGDNGRGVVPAAAPVVASDGAAEDAAADASEPDAVSAGAAGAGVAAGVGVGDGDGDSVGDGEGVKANPNWDGGSVEGSDTGDTNGASLGMGSVDGGGTASAEDAAGGDGVPGIDGGEAADGLTGTDRANAAADPAGAPATPVVPLDRALAQTTDLSAQVALMSSAPCVRTLPTGSLGSTTPLCVTGEYFLDVQVDPSAPIERMTVAIFGHAVPKSAVNWHALATCTGMDEAACFRNDSFHRIVPNFVIQGGNRGTGRSVFGSTFREEVSPERHSVLSHSARGVLAWAEYPIGSQFYITAGAATYLDNNHVVFGILADGLDVAHKIQTLPLVNGAPAQRVSIVSAGLLNVTPPGPVTPPGTDPPANSLVGPATPPVADAASAPAAAPAPVTVRMGEALSSGGNLTAGGNVDGAAAGAATVIATDGHGTTNVEGASDGDGPGGEGGAVGEPPAEGESVPAEAVDALLADGEASAAAAGAMAEVPREQA